ncbi:MAG TPA: sulfite exporter TauE/SafE family protein [Alphaproteobacteria bacterium]|nr:sulfite exporter TauE/SafE family protein [Alphaproteobacteria bacterium]
MDIDAATLASAVFLFLGGAVKGVAGVGLPLVALPLLTTVVSVKTAVGLLVVPIIATNFAQSFEGGRFVPTLRRFWPVIACLVAVIVFGVNALVLIPEPVLYAVMGASIIAFPLAAQIWPHLRVAPAHEGWAGPLVGALAGLIGGASSLYGPPLFLYLGALRLPKEEFVPAISMLFLSGTLGLTIGMLSFRILAPADLVASLAATVPVFLGLWLGQKVRRRLPQRRFDRVLLILYLTTGLSLLARAAA